MYISDTYIGMCVVMYSACRFFIIVCRGGTVEPISYIEFQCSVCLLSTLNTFLRRHAAHSESMTIFHRLEIDVSCVVTNQKHRYRVLVYVPQGRMFVGRFMFVVVILVYRFILFSNVIHLVYLLCVVVRMRYTSVNIASSTCLASFVIVAVFVAPSSWLPHKQCLYLKTNQCRVS